MTTRIVITSNCHAQYYAAALQSLGIAETRCVGRPFAGPIQFRGTTARFLQPSEVSEWLEQSNAHHRIIVRQTTFAAPSCHEGSGASARAIAGTISAASSSPTPRITAKIRTGYPIAIP